MPNRQKSRTHKTSSGERHERNRKRQDARESINKAGQSIPDFLTPWETSKARRHKKRIRAGKTYNNWLKRQRDSKKPTVSNLATGIASPVNGGTLSVGRSSGVKRDHDSAQSRLANPATDNSFWNSIGFVEPGADQ